MSVANSYAKALYEAAKENKANTEAFDQIETQLTQVSELLRQSKELRAALVSPITTHQEKLKIISEVSKNMGFTQLIQQFVTLLVKKDRLDLIQEINDSFNSVRLTNEGGVSGQLISAEPMNEADLNTLAKAFSQKLGKKVAFRVSTDPELLAGMKVTVNGITYDGTLRSQLQKLRDRFVVGIPGAHA